MDPHQYQIHQQQNVSHPNMGILDDPQNSYTLWNPDSQQMYMNTNEYGMHSSNQVYYPDPTSNNHAHPQSQPQHSQSQHQMLMMPPPQKSPQVSSPMNYVNLGQSPHGYAENGATSDDSDDSGLRSNSLKRPSPEPLNEKVGSPNSVKSLKPIAAKKPKVQRKKKKKDPNEPQKPVSAYALFFRDTQAAIKSQNPTASFGEVSTIVASMWDVLAPEHKDVYKKKTEAAKIEYLKTLAAYRASVISKGNDVPNAPPMHTPPQQPAQVNHLHAAPQSQVSPQQGHPMQHQNTHPQTNQYIQQQQQPHAHNSYPQYISSYKSPPQHLEYAPPGSMQSNVQAQHQMHQMGMNAMGPAHGSHPNSMNYAYDHHPNQSQHSINSLVNNSPYNINQHQQQPPPQQQQQQHQHQHPQQIPPQANTAIHNQNSHHIAANAAGQQQQQQIHNLATAETGLNPAPANSYPNPQHAQQCIRHGCTNQAMVSPDWEDEYCSNECVIFHCGDVFGNWIQKNGQQQQPFSVVK